MSIMDSIHLGDWNFGNSLTNMNATMTVRTCSTIHLLICFPPIARDAKIRLRSNNCKVDWTHLVFPGDKDEEGMQSQQKTVPCCFSSELEWYRTLGCLIWFYAGFHCSWSGLWVLMFTCSTARLKKPDWLVLNQENPPDHRENRRLTICYNT